MRCPYCGKPDSRVVDSRDVRDGESIRRRRECVVCGRRFTTYETVEARELVVVKRDGRREPFSQRKLTDKLLIALTKRPVPMTEVERIVREIETELIDRNASEVSSTDIGELVLVKLKELDQIAYIRFASVYREFRDLDDWRREMATLDETRRASDAPSS
ncbi:MAG TPA: transcriptional regulator NrdR [Thermomicrobiales bacterium]|jgi:transcriptional repressor NrdR|nr:transcriptional regulator NrdR [Chloroflexota bacterium]HCG30057.1 transcriptional regulator NrdR [Chloroflexota bacterium]HQX62497.1 transcriptional regulator NrdR [Thermomicrobiales bacterium]HQZ89193.1 transcriptional regulator NrdR [Thermomicrobiales bacterium]HRA31111.1 transcriptional regulator NrdR [Thermomicrobiales bacterium]